MTRSEAGRLIESGLVIVDGTPASKSQRLRGNEMVEVRVPAGSTERAEGPAPRIVMEDTYLAVVSKPAGLLTHGTPGGKSSSLVEALGVMMPLAESGGPERPGIVHRLDKDTSGLLIVAKTNDAYRLLVEAMRERRIVRRYLALVLGAFSLPTGRIEAPVGRSARNPTKMEVAGGGRAAVTEFEVKEDLRFSTLVDAGLHTGRTHQIRVHFAHVGHPVVGDRTYGRSAAELAGRLGLVRPFLHAYRLELEHPLTGKPMKFADDLPADLATALDRAREMVGMKTRGSPK
jgi:23S rRNA pseudouridine1911/1915/1917 synthase